MVYGWYLRLVSFPPIRETIEEPARSTRYRIMSAKRPPTSRRGVGTVPMLIPLDANGSVPLHRQIYQSLRAAILEGRLAAGSRLPASRVLADDIGVSRTTVLGAYEQLAAEGYVVGSAGGGTRVARGIDKPSRSRSVARAQPANGTTGASAELSRLGRTMIATIGPFRPGRPFAPLATGVPALDAFPYATWTRLATRRWRNSPREMILPGDGPGYRPLREAIAEYVLTARSVRCTPDQVVITAGAQQGIDLAARLLLDPGDRVWMEEPCYWLARAAIAGVGAEIISVPVDADGMDVAAARQLAPRARLAFVTPSYQAPLGVTMTLRRRLALLDWANESRAWIIEDDYNAEFRYDGRPTAAMQGLEHPGTRRVIYLGTFSKTLFPALRIGYAILPPELVDPFWRARIALDRFSPMLEQATLADFIAEGHFARHVRRMRTLYAQRQELFLRLAERHLGDVLRVDPAPAGMRLIGWLPEGVDDVSVVKRVARRGITVASLSRQRITSTGDPGLILGYVPFRASEMRRAMIAIAEVVRSELSNARRPR